MKACDFTRNDCKVGKRRLEYATLAVNYRCGKCGARLALKWMEASDDYPDSWGMFCGRGCEAHDFVHEVALMASKAEAIEVLDGLPPEVAVTLK